MPSVAATTSGRLDGKSADGIHAFKGIPYATAARFRAPVPVATPAAERDAVAYGPSCPQRYLAPEDVTPDRAALSEVFGIPLLEHERQDEDCLVLNVWTPGLADGAARPVLVRFHGRGFHGGSGSWAWADGERLARRGDAVVVTVNHRLPVLGHLFLDGLAPGLDGAGNAGILDLVAALEWVRENAPAFGGDPGNMTIFGESGGGAKVATLLRVPAARGLFQRAIVQSGAGFAPVPRDRATELAEALLDELGLDAGRLDALAELPVERILAAQLAVAAQVGGGPTARFQRVPPYRPVLDGTVVTDGPTAPVPLMIGTARHEFSMFLAVEGLADPGGFRVDEPGLRERLAAMLGERTDAVVEAYRAAEPGLSATDVLVLALSDAAFRVPSLELAAAHDAPAFAYLLAWGSPALDGFLRATHGLCVPLTMDTCSVVPMADVPDGRLMTELMSETWLAFARTGDPNHAGLPRWEPYDADARATMVLDLPPALVEDPYGAQRRAERVAPSRHHPIRAMRGAPACIRLAGPSDLGGRTMAIGPVQLIVLGFDHPEFHGEIIAELERLKESDTVRVIDALAVHKDADGEIEVVHLSNLTKDEAVELGSKVGALIGLGIEGEEGMYAGAVAGAEAAEDGVEVFSDEDAWDVLEEIQNDSAAALILLEHHWAVPLRDAIARAGGFRISDGFISPLDLVAIGLVSSEEARELELASAPRGA